MMATPSSPTRVALASKAIGGVITPSPPNSDISQPALVQTRMPLSTTPQRRLNPVNYRKSLSCDGCIQYKLKCDRTPNCSACKSRARPCLWTKSKRPTSYASTKDLHHRTPSTMTEDEAFREISRLRTLVQYLAKKVEETDADKLRQGLQQHDILPKPEDPQEELTEEERAQDEDLPVSMDIDVFAPPSPPPAELAPSPANAFNPESRSHPYTPGPRFDQYPFVKLQFPVYPED